MGLPASGIIKASDINLEAARATTANAPLGVQTGTAGTGSLVKLYDNATPSPVDQNSPYAYSDFYGKSYTPPTISCDSGLSQGGGGGYFEANINFGSDTGAIIVYFWPQSVPDGVAFTYNGTTYNTLTSINNGLYTATANTLNIVGSATGSCTEAKLIAASPIDLDTSVLSSSTSPPTFQPNGGTASIVTASGNINLGGAGLNYTLVIPKTSTTPSTGVLKIVGPCSGLTPPINTAWNVKVICPASLDSFTTNSVAASSTIACCTATQNQTYYFARNTTNGSSFTPETGNTTPLVNNFVFSNSTGATALANGYYKINSTQALYVQNGVVDSIVTCPTCVTLTGFNVGNPSAFVADMCSQTAPGGNTYYHDGSTTYPVVNDIVYLSNDTSSPVDGGSGIQWPYFANGATLGDSPLAYFRITGSSGTVQSVTNCP